MSGSMKKGKPAAKPATDVRGRLKGTSAQMLRENPYAQVAVAMVLGPDPRGHGFQVAMRGDLDRQLGHDNLVATFRGLADALEAQGPAVPTTYEALAGVKGEA